MKWLLPVALAGIAVSMVFWFSSGNVAIERATYTVVEGGLEVGGAITLEFTGTIARATATSRNIRLVDAQDVTVPAEVSLGSDEMSVSISPRSPLAYGATYTLVVSDSLTGASGRAVQGPGGTGTGASIVISTQAIPAGVGPPSLTPADGFDPGTVPAAGPIRIRFSAPINPITATAGGVRLATADGQPVEAALLFTEGNREVRIEPASPLSAGGRYVVRIDSTLTGATGLGVCAAEAQAAGQDGSGVCGDVADWGHDGLGRGVADESGWLGGRREGRAGVPRSFHRRDGVGHGALRRPGGCAAA